MKTSDLEKLQKLQNSLDNAKAKIINSKDTTSFIQRKYDSKYTDDISDSDDDCTSSYKSRHKKSIESINKKKETKKEKEEEGSEQSVEIDQATMEKLQKIVAEYVETDNKVRELQEQVKNLNNKKKAAEGEIMSYLEKCGETCVGITGGKLRLNKYESKGGLKEDIIKESILEKVKDPKIVESILETINEKRENNSKAQTSIKRTFDRTK